MTQPWRLAILAVVLATLSGCATLGAQHLAGDRRDYTEQLRLSERTQLLANIVALRRGEAPLFLSVTSVINQYTRETTGELDLDIRPSPGDQKGEADLTRTFRETPTVTYTPVTGERLAHSLLAPIPPASLVAMLESGWAADDVFTVALSSVNGVRNQSTAPLFARDSDPEFTEVVAAMRRLQRRGALSIRVIQQDKAFQTRGRLRADLTDADRADLALLRRDLKLSGKLADLHIVFAAEAGPDELALVTRSIFQILQEMSQGVDLDGGGAFSPGALIRVHSGASKPRETYAAVQRDGRWFWIEQGDDASKRAFLIAQLMLSLNDVTSTTGTPPLVTIPAG